MRGYSRLDGMLWVVPDIPKPDALGIQSRSACRGALIKLELDKRSLSRHRTCGPGNNANVNPNMRSLMIAELTYR